MVSSVEMFYGRARCAMQLVIIVEWNHEGCGGELIWTKISVASTSVYGEATQITFGI